MFEPVFEKGQLMLDYGVSHGGGGGGGGGVVMDKSGDFGP